MKKKGSVPIAKQDLWIHSVIMMLHVMSGRYDFATQPPKGQNFFLLQRWQPVTSLRAEKPDTRNNFSTWRYVFTLMVFWATGSSAYNHYIPTGTQYYFKCGEEVWLCPESCGRQEVGAIFTSMCQHRCSFYYHGFSIIWRTL